MNTFQETYDDLKHDFLHKDRFYTSSLSSRIPLRPDTPGVYAIWMRDSDAFHLLYIGKFGTFKRDETGIVRMNLSTFVSQKSRWTPYRFAESKKDGEFHRHFRFGPKEKNTDKQRKIMHEKDAYSTSIPYDKISIDFFVIDEWNDRYTPALVESMLLTSFLKEFNTLPPANNSL